MAVEQLTQALTRPEPVRPVDEEPLSQFPSVEELARKLGLNVKTVTESFERGELPGRRIGRRILFSREAVLEWFRGDPPRGRSTKG